MFGFFKKFLTGAGQQGVPAVPPSPGEEFFWAVPWDAERPSLYAFVRACVENGSETSPDLPDDDVFNAENQIRWVAGAMDNLIGNEEGDEGGEYEADQRVVDVHASLAAAARTLGDEEIRQLYECLIAGRTIVYIDALIPALTKDSKINVVNVLSLARWLTLRAPDREAVKFGIALWGLAKGETEREVFLTLGRHEEFTVYAMVALSYLVPDEEHDALWLQMARHVHGWGRIRLVERLSVTENEEIKAWLLREGYKNYVMHEYLAYSCAVGGGLAEALRAPKVESDVLVGAAELLQALISDGPGRDIREYEEGAEAVRLFLGQLTFAPPVSLECFLAAYQIALFMRDETTDWKGFPPGWGEGFRHKMAEMAVRITARVEWRAVVDQGLVSENDDTFWMAATVADILELDTWPIRFERLRQGKSGQWYYVAQTDDPARMDQVVALAEETLEPLSDDDGPGQNLEIEFVVQGLGNFPGKGWPLVRSALRSPVGRHRMVAVRTLGEWGRESWSAEIHQALESALFQEQDEDIHDSMHSVLMGRPLE